MPGIDTGSYSLNEMSLNLVLMLKVKQCLILLVVLLSKDMYIVRVASRLSHQLTSR
jgi:hypothetical protein